jgi:ribosomal protein S18 acetylase RimI-like enzyme
MMHDDSNPNDVRTLVEVDAAAFREIRLRALCEAPVPFLASHAEDAARSVEDFAARLRSSDPAVQVLGAFRDGVLVGILGFYRHPQIKARHRSSLWGMYVTPEQRRRGIGRILLNDAIARLRAVGDVEQVELTVVRTEEPARRLYLSAGFQIQGVLRRAMKMGDEYFDEESMVLWLSDVHVA